MPVLIMLGIGFFLFIVSKIAGNTKKARENEARRRLEAEKKSKEKMERLAAETVKQLKAEQSLYGIDLSSEISEARDVTLKYKAPIRTSKIKWKVEPSRVFKDNYLSYSRLSMFDKCPRQFELIYLCGNPDVSGEAAEKGSVVHKIAELAAENYVGKPTSDIYQDHSSDSLLEYYQEAVRQVEPAHTIRPNTITSLLDNFVDSCDVDSEQVIWKNETVIDTHIGGYPIKCIIDRVDETDMGVKLIDYKTGNKRYVKNLQLEIYGTAYNEEEPGDEIQLEYQFLKDGTAKTWPATNSTFSRTTDTITRKAREIESTTTFLRKKTPLCNYCAVAHLCYS